MCGGGLGKGTPPSQSSPVKGEEVLQAPPLDARMREHDGVGDRVLRAEVLDSSLRSE